MNQHGIISQTPPNYLFTYNNAYKRRNLTPMANSVNINKTPVNKLNNKLQISGTKDESEYKKIKEHYQ